MMTRAIILFMIMIVFALLFFSSFVSTLIGFTKKRKKLWAIGLVVCLSSACLFSLTMIYTSTKVVKRTFTAARTLIETVDSRITEYVDPSPGSWFTELTGLEWPKTAKIVATGDDYWVFDWESYIVFETDHEVLDTWLSNPPPWGTEKWIAGPVPSGVLQSSFGTDGVFIWRDSSGSDRYKGDERLIKLVTSNHVWYAAKEYCCSDLRFHSGHLIIIDPDSNRVWVASWDH